MSKELKITEILNEAKKCKNKGRWYVYEQYKQELAKLCLTATEYQQICRKLERYLGV